MVLKVRRSSVTPARGFASVRARDRSPRSRWRAAGFAAATLTTGPGTRAERFYRENGWEETGRKDDGEIIFRKPL
jgi:hypothetical protein